MEPITMLAIGGAVALLAKSKKGASTGRPGEKTVTSSREDLPESYSGSADGSPFNELEGIAYSYGAGGPSTPWGEAAKGIKGGAGLDCSGAAQMMMVGIGKLEPTDPDRSSSALAAMSTEIPWGSQKWGDLAFYGSSRSKVSHVMVCNENARKADGDCEVIGASGGTSKTNGDDPNARVKRFGSAKYRKDFLFFGRLP